MTYNTRKRVNTNYSDTSESINNLESFEERECVKLVEMLKNEFLDLKKINDYLSENTEKITSLNEKEYLKVRKNLLHRMEQFKKYLSAIHSIIEKIKKLMKKTYNAEFNKNIDESIQVTKKKVLDLIDEYPKYENAIQEKDRSSNVNLVGDISGLDTSGNHIINNTNNQSLLLNNTSEIDNLRMSLLVVAEIQTQEEFMTKREDKLRDIHYVSNQINHITGHMRTEVNNQGQILNKIEDNIVVVNENVNKADGEIDFANKENRKVLLKQILIILLILLLVGGIVTIIVLAAI